MRMRIKGIFAHLPKLVQPIMKTVWSFLQKLKIELPDDPPIPLLGLYPREMKSVCQKAPVRPYYCSTSHNTKKWQHPKHPSMYILTMEYFLAVRRMKSSHLQKHLQLGIIVLNEINQAQRDTSTA
jgi:hypothetical protein